ncbi:MAG: arabinan endo-1,5-alpha-L-arabinosidase [Caldilinea sp. CFX5]|nr:arabinan endo-1,5-alpha-L-arabinosidase [Caldilinea sp. CFX5]
MNALRLHSPRRLRLVVVTFFVCIAVVVSSRSLFANGSRYQNPLPVRTPAGMVVESCADPSVIQAGAAWYLYCTTDPLSSTDRDSNGRLIFHLIPIFTSTDLVNWTYVGDAFATRPGWVAADAGLWAPEIEFFNNQYYLYYTASNTSLPGGSAIGVATSPSPTGPWTDTGTPVVEPHAPPCCPNDRRWTFDPALITDDSGQRYIYYGSYFGGISARVLSADGLTSDPNSQVQITIANRYEGGYVVRRDGYYYLFASATDCCRGPLTGYSVFVGRSTSPLGPFVDREGVSLLAGRVGGTPVISMNGNRWVGPGHNAVITDLAGQDWFFYHAIDRNDPYFAGEVGFTKRPVLVDALDWVDGWPTVRNGNWASDKPQPKPVAQPGDRPRDPDRPLPPQTPGRLLQELSTEFDGATLPSNWNWVRPPAGGFGLENGTFRFDTQAADLFESSNNASVLRVSAPRHDYIVETRVKLNLPSEGCCFNFVQAGLMIYGNDDNYIKLVHVSIWETRQTEFAKEEGPVAAGYPRYGNTVVSSPDEWTYLRIARRVCGNEECYAAYISRDGATWTRGGTWTHRLRNDSSIGLVAMGGTGFTANFDYVRVYRLESPGGPGAQ